MYVHIQCTNVHDVYALYVHVHMYMHSTSSANVVCTVMKLDTLKLRLKFIVSTLTYARSTHNGTCILSHVTLVFDDWGSCWYTLCGHSMQYV